MEELDNWIKRNWKQKPHLCCAVGKQDMLRNCNLQNYWNGGNFEGRLGALVYLIQIVHHRELFGFVVRKVYWPFPVVNTEISQYTSMAAGIRNRQLFNA